MSRIYFLFQWVLTFFLIYASFVCLYISLIKNSFDISTIILLFTLFILTIISIRVNISSNIEFTKIKIDKKKVFLLSFCICSFLLAFMNVYTQFSRGLAYAEMGQFMYGLFSTNIMEASYKQQQTPLDYYFTSLSGILFGTSKFAIRCHAIFFYLCLSFILPLGLYFLCSSFLGTIFGMILFLLNHIIRLNAISGRPLSLALFTGFLFLFFYLSYCKKKNPERRDFFWILTSQYLFAISIGLQPVIFISSLFISSFLFKKDILKLLIFLHLSVGVLISPFYFNMTKFGASAYKFKSISMSSIHAYVTGFSFSEFFRKYFQTSFEQMAPFFTILMSVLVIIFLMKKIDKITLMTFLCVFIFLLIYDPLFNGLIIWVNNDWYFITLSLFFILFTAFALRDIQKALIFNKKVYYAFFILLSIVFFRNTYLQGIAIKNETQFYYPYRDNSVELVYDYLEKVGDSDDIVVQFSLKPIVSFRERQIIDQKMVYHTPKHPRINSYYLEYTKEPPFFWEIPHDLIYYVDRLNLSERRGQKVFFIVINDEDRVSSEEDKAYYVLKDILVGKDIGFFTIFELVLNKEKGYIEFLSLLKKKTPKKQRGVIYETLLYYAYKNKKRKKFYKLLEEYKDLNSFLDEKINVFKFPSRFEHGRRVKYFDNLEWD